jgi:Cytochrome c
MKKIMKRASIIVVSLAVIGFLAFLYLIPPFDLLPRDAFIKPYQEAVDSSLLPIQDPVQRLIAERGRYVVRYSDCNGCHTAPGDQGPQWEKYLAGGMKFSWKKAGTALSRNLTPDKETGLGVESDAQILRALRNGISHNGRVMEFTFMPWSAHSNMTEEDRYAVLMYLRHIKPIKHKIPEWSPQGNSDTTEIYAGDYSQKK